MELSSWIYLNRERSKYRVTIDGHVYSTEFNGKRGDVRELKVNHDVDGYCIIALNHKGRKYTRKIHRLVAEAFIYNKYGLPEVNHIDGNKENNSVDNLEWVSTYQNIQHAIDNNLRKYPNSEEQVITACELMELNMYYLDEISEKTGISVENLRRIRYGKAWTHISENYNIDRYTLGEQYKNHHDVGTPTITENVAIEICELLEHTKMTAAEIAEKVGVTQGIVYHIKYRDNWKNVSQQYNFWRKDKIIRIM